MAATVPLSKLEQEHHLVTAFSFFDKDGNGFITRDELELAFDGYKMELLEDIIKVVDQNNVSYFCLKIACAIAICLIPLVSENKAPVVKRDQWS